MGGSADIQQALAMLGLWAWIFYGDRGSVTSDVITCGSNLTVTNMSPFQLLSNLMLYSASVSMETHL